MKIINSTIPSLGLYMYSYAIKELAALNNIDETQMLLEAAQAIRNGELKTRDPKTGAFFKGDMKNPSPYLTVTDFNLWLDSGGYPFAWEPSVATLSSIASTTTPINPPTYSPPPLLKREIATAFADLHFSREKWMKHLGDPPKWLKPCRQSLGSRGQRASAKWDPTEIGLLLLDKGVMIRQLDAVFVRLKSWQPIWQDKTELMR